MFEVLVESASPRRPGMGPRIASLTLHGMAVLFAVLGWRRMPATSSATPQVVPMGIYTEPALSSGHPGAGSGIETTIGPAPEVPSRIPTAIPSIQVATMGPFVPTAAQVLAGRELWGTAPGGPQIPVDSLHLAGEVDEPVEVIRARQPVYPAALAAAGVDGSVRLEFVVDTAGRGEPGSVRVIGSTTAAFEQAAIDAVLGSEYRAARVRGVAVRQLVQQRIVFRVP